MIAPADAAGLSFTTPANLDPTRRTARVTLDGAPAQIVPGGRRDLVDLARTILAAEATGVGGDAVAMLLGGGAGAGP